MQSHWLRVAPPTYITTAAAVEYKGREADGEEDDDLISDPDDLMNYLGTLGGGIRMP